MNILHRWLQSLRNRWMVAPQDQDELLALLHRSQQNQIVDSGTYDMIAGAIRVAHLQVRDAMIPRPQMVVIDGYLTPQQVLPQVIEAGHSRYPVTGEDRDEIVGVLLAKDLLRFSLPETPAPTYVRQLVRPATFIPESKRLNILLKEFRSNHNHMAVVVDEYGGVSGLITIEDVLEEIVGEIADEYDIEEEPFIKPSTKAGEFIVKALTPLDEFNAYFHTQFQEEDMDTIGGLVLKKLSYLPKRGESLILGSLKITVVEAGKRRIQLLQVQQLPPAET